MRALAQLLGLASGLTLVAAAALWGWRVWSAPGPSSPSVAIYAPVSMPVKRGAVEENERPANGFILVVETTPDAMELSVDGVVDGPTPSSRNFECKPGAAIALTLKRAGYITMEHTIHCKADTMLIVTARPEPLRKR